MIRFFYHSLFEVALLNVLINKKSKLDHCVCFCGSNLKLSSELKDTTSLLVYDHVLDSSRSTSESRAARDTGTRDMMIHTAAREAQYATSPQRATWVAGPHCRPTVPPGSAQEVGPAS